MFKKKGRKIFYLLILFCLVFLVGNVSAVKPQPQIISNGCEIRLPQATTLEQNQDIEFHTHVINTTEGASNFLTNDTTICFVHLYNQSGHTLQINMSFDPNGLEWGVDILGGNFSQIGEFAFYIQCEADDVICADSGAFEVTKSGRSALTSGEGMIFLASMVSMILIAIFFLVLSFTVEKENGLRFGFIGFSFVIFIMVILYAFIALNEILPGFTSIINNFTTFHYVIMTAIIIIFILVLIDLIFKAVNELQIKKGLKDRE